jgi:hypothetical protein
MLIVCNGVEEVEHSLFARGTERWDHLSDAPHLEITELSRHTALYFPVVEN